MVMVRHILLNYAKAVVFSFWHSILFIKEFEKRKICNMLRLVFLEILKIHPVIDKYWGFFKIITKTQVFAIYCCSQTKHAYNSHAIKAFTSVA